MTYLVLESNNRHLPSLPAGTPHDHPLLDGVETLAFQSSCSLEPELDCELLVTTADECEVRRAVGPTNSDRKIIQVRDYILDRRECPVFLLARRSGKGKIVGIGSWKIFLNELLEDGTLSNVSLLQNAVRWISS